MHLHQNIVPTRLFSAICLLCTIAMLSSCKKFLASYSQNQTFNQTASDLEELLLGQGYAIQQPIVWAHLLDDDVDGNPTPNSSGGSATFNFSGYHNWQPVPSFNNFGAELFDDYYTAMYKRIAAFNTILYDAPEMKRKGEPADQLRKVSGESHFLRAWYYYYLANLYGQPYNQATASIDYCVPLKTDPAVEDKVFSRNTVREVFDQILSDLLESEKELDTYNENSNIRINKTTAQAMLSRVYLFMSDYENAITYANKVISNNRYRIIDLNSPAPGIPFLDKSSPENILCFPSPQGSSLFLKMQNSSFSFGDNFKVSQELRSSFSANDLRAATFFEQSGNGEVLARKGGNNMNEMEAYIIRLPELYLNKAEALAILGRDAEAAMTLQELRKQRFKPEHLIPITETGAALVNFIREERRKELCFEWHRWFDLRRYAMNARFPFEKSIRHTAYGYNSSGRYVQGYYELKPYSQDKATWVAPVSKSEIEFNQGAIKNEVRPERPIIR
jgi:tetratricopeptide (TPR) repeat protein